MVDPSKATSNNPIAASVWVPPLFGQVKFLVDGSTTALKAGCGEILGDESRNIRIMFLSPTATLGPNFAELMAIVTALEFFIEAKWIKRLILLWNQI
ncbi:hypothetical protein V6N13_113637 [Hibiscus sabdariffa]